MDTKLDLLHPSLGLAFTTMFHRPMGPPTIIQGNKVADQLPDGCDGCCEDMFCNLQCCQEMDHEPR